MKKNRNEPSAITNSTIADGVNEKPAERDKHDVELVVALLFVQNAEEPNKYVLQ